VALVVVRRVKKQFYTPVKYTKLELKTSEVLANSLLTNMSVCSCYPISNEHARIGEGERVIKKALQASPSNEVKLCRAFYVFDVS